MICSTIYEILEQAEKQYGAEDMVRCKVKKDTIESRSYTQMKEDSLRFAGVLAALGEKGSHVALTGPTSYPWLVTYLGTVISGSVAVPLDASLPAKDMCELIDRADAAVLVTDDARADVASLARELCPKVKYIISMQGEENDGEVLSLSQLLQGKFQAGNFENPTEITNAAGASADASDLCAEAAVSVCTDPDALCTIMFTSGTTGKSKGVMLTQRSLAENATSLDMKFPPRTVVLSVLPIHHAYCLTMDILKGMTIGAVICINDSLMRMARNMKLFQPDMILMVPLMIETLARKLEEAKGLPPEIVKKEVFGSNLHTICSGGAYLNPSYIDLFAAYGIKILQGYGMTECAPVISTNRPWNMKKESVGQLMPNCEAKIVDGELWVRGSSVMQGYYKMPEETADALQDGWLKTGDLGYVDEEGFVYLTGRRKNLIITRNGENVSPEELENKIGEDPLVREILVREKENVIEAEIFPDMEYAETHQLTDLRGELQAVIDRYNQEAPLYKRVYRLTVRDTEFDKTPSKKIKRY